MVIFVAVKLKKLFKKKRNYSWPRLESCPRCSDYKVWGHGYAQAIFDGFKEPLLLKLYRCHVCGCVIRLRPSGYFKRFQPKQGSVKAPYVAGSDFITTAILNLYTRTLASIRVKAAPWMKIPVVPLFDYAGKCRMPPQHI